MKSESILKLSGGHLFLFQFRTEKCPSISAVLILQEQGDLRPKSSQVAESTARSSWKSSRGFTFWDFRAQNPAG